MTRTVASRVILLALAGASLAAPATGEDAGWLAGEGAREPSTRWDGAGFMWPFPNDAAHAPAERVYMNGLLVHWPGGSTQLEGGTVMGQAVRHAAFLGYWRDCNNDGYVGARSVSGTHASSYGHWSTGAYPYATSGLDETVCRPGSPYARTTFVDEFRWIGPGAGAPRASRDAPTCGHTGHGAPGVLACFARAGNDVSDPDARVWADFGHPLEPAATTRSIFTWHAFDNASATLALVNALTGLERALESERDVRVFGFPVWSGTLLPPGTWASLPNVGACDEDPEFLGGPDGQCGLYPLWQAKRVVNDSRDEHADATPLVTVFDVQEDKGESGSPCDDTSVSQMRMADVQPRIATDPFAHGSLTGTFVNVYAGTGGGRFDGQCASPPPTIGFTDATAPPGKTAPDAILRFHPARHWAGSPVVGITDIPADALGLLGGPAAPGGGLEPVQGKRPVPDGGGRWLASSGYVVNGLPRGVLAPTFTTFYADVTQAAFDNAGEGASVAALPSGTDNAFEYGREECQGDYSDTSRNRAPNAYGWVCSRSAWEEEGGRRAITPGTPYDLRDVDCHDQRVTEEVGVDDVAVHVPPYENPLRIRASCAGWG